MSPLTRRIACAVVFACWLVSAVHGEEAAPANIVVTQAWSRATPGGSKVAGGYFTIENKGPVADKLLSASTDAAKKVEIHEMAVTEGVMTMRPVEGGLTIEPGHTVKFAPGGLHLMMAGLSASLKQGDQVPVSLNFEKAGVISASFEVQGMGAPASGPPSHTAPPAAPSSAQANDDFFIHLHDQRVMANVTISAVRAGTVEIAIQLETVEELPLEAEAVSVTLGNPDKGIAPVTAQAQRTADDQWSVKIATSVAGRWNLGLGITLAPANTVNIASPILIY